MQYAYSMHTIENVKVTPLCIVGHRRHVYGIADVNTPLFSLGLWLFLPKTLAKVT